jgi:hypothetical protein
VTARAASFLAALALLAGCGSDEDDIARVGRTYFTALADGDGPKACAQLTDKARAGFAHSLGAPSYGLSCEEFVGQKLYLFVGRDGKDAYRGVKLSPVEIDGDKATAGNVHFRREGGRWRVEPAFGAP